MIMDNLFSSVVLFVDILGKNTYTTGTVRDDCIGQKIILYKMHSRAFIMKNA